MTKPADKVILKHYMGDDVEAIITHEGVTYIGEGHSVPEALMDLATRMLGGVEEAEDMEFD